jgi:murein endopeptidase
MHLGMDSVMSLVLRRKLEQRFGHPVPAGLLWQRPTPAAIATSLAMVLRGDLAPVGGSWPDGRAGGTDWPAPSPRLAAPPLRHT